MNINPTNKIFSQLLDKFYLVRQIILIGLGILDQLKMKARLMPGSVKFKIKSFLVIKY